MSFISKSVNYSQTQMLKTQLLWKALEQYNATKLFPKSFMQTVEYLIPNNNKKYYIYVTNKGNLEQRGDPFDVLYFFPDDLSVEYYKKTTTKPELSDFYIEMDRGVFNDNYLFEGYIYEDTMTSGLQVVMLTDILVKGSNVIDLDYPLRHSLIVELTMGLGTLNNHTQLTVHPYVIGTNDCLLQVFKANFKYKCELVCVEHIVHSKKERYLQPSDTGVQSKWIKQGKYPDNYLVYNDATGAYEGILYIKGLAESRKMINHFNEHPTEKHKIECKFNMTFRKWQPCLN